jgi:1-acyl-sn-glycerol-3-phosphate acyltransferase
MIFFSGFAILASRTARPVVLVYIRNAYMMYPADVWLARWHRIKVVIGPPVFHAEGESDEAFKQRVYAWFRM